MYVYIYIHACVYIYICMYIYMYMYVYVCDICNDICICPMDIYILYIRVLRAQQTNGGAPPTLSLRQATPGCFCPDLMPLPYRILEGVTFPLGGSLFYNNKKEAHGPLFHGATFLSGTRSVLIGDRASP